jgi:hypothetical protein
LKKKRTAAVKEHELHELRAGLEGLYNENAEKITVDEPKDDEPPKTVKPGDTVLLLDLNATATVLTAPDKKGECQVQTGAMKLKANIKRMRLTKAARGEKTEDHGARQYFHPCGGNGVRCARQYAG